MSRQRLILVGAVVAAVIVAAAVFRFRRSAPATGPVAGRERSMEMLGASIARLRPGCNVIVLANPFTREAGYLHQASTYERASVRGLSKGLGEKVSVKVVYPEILPDFLSNPQSIPVPPDSRCPVSYVLQPKSIVRLAEANPDCKVIVSLIGLPVGIAHTKLWEEGDPRAFALLLPDLRHLGAPAQVAAAFERGKLLTAAVEDLHSGAALIVTRDNIAQILENQPNVFGY